MRRKFNIADYSEAQYKKERFIEKWIYIKQKNG